MNNIYRGNEIYNNLCVANFRPLDVLVVGSTGAGKSSTINALFEKDIAKVGRGCDPETNIISSMSMNNLMRFWDSPGLGDNVTNDIRYANELKNLLYRCYRMDNSRYGLIDTVLVILDGSGRDLGTTYKILNDIITPNFQIDRILVAINQADVAMSGRHWNEQNNCPDDVLLDFLERKVESICSRLKENTDVNAIKPVYYSAERGYNIDKLLDMIIDNMPKNRRQLVA